VQTLLASIISC